MTWRRVVDMNDRALRQIVTLAWRRSKRLSRVRLVLTSPLPRKLWRSCASANDLEDLEERLGISSLPIAATAAGLCRDIKAEGAMTVLLKDAMQPNLVQTLENNPAFVHGGPFANIAHGCNSVLRRRRR